MTVVSARAARLSAASVPAAFLAANLLSYGLLLAAAHRMTASAYGELSSLLGLLLVASIPMLALQTVAARRAAVGVGRHELRAGTLRIAAAATVLLAALSPALAAFLHLNGVLGVLLVAVTAPSLSLIGTATGVAQGRREFRRLAVLVLGGTGGRAVGGVVAVLTFATPVAALAGIALGAALTAGCIVWDTARRDRAASRVASRAPSGAGTFVAETAHAAHAHGLFLLITSLDVLLARHALSPAQAGTYAVGAVLTRAALWLPQSVVMLFFASMAHEASRRAAGRRATGITLGFGVLALAGTALLGPVVVAAVGGARYHRLDTTVWAWTLLGALLSVVQLAVLVGLAQRSRRRAALLWAVLGADLVVVLGIGGVDTPQRLVTALDGVAGLAAVVSLWLVLRDPRASARAGLLASCSTWTTRRTKPSTPPGPRQTPSPAG